MVSACPLSYRGDLYSVGWSPKRVTVTHAACAPKSVMITASDAGSQRYPANMLHEGGCGSATAPLPMPFGQR